MAKQTINTLKNWFRTGLKPTQAQFWDWMDSYFHKDDKIPVASIDGIQAEFDKCRKTDTDIEISEVNGLEEALENGGVTTLHANLTDLATSGHPASAISGLSAAIALVAESDFVKLGGNTVGSPLVLGTKTQQPVSIIANNAQAIKVSSNGFVGIYNHPQEPPYRLTIVQDGVTPQTSPVLVTPEHKNCTLSVQGAGRAFIMTRDTTNNLEVVMGTSPLYGGYIGTTVNTAMAIRANNIEVVVVTPSQRVIIGGALSSTSRLNVNGAVQVADDTSVASATNKGAIRYREDANNSYIEQCMKVGVSSYAWVILKQNIW